MNVNKLLNNCIYKNIDEGCGKLSSVTIEYYNEEIYISVYCI